MWFSNKWNCNIAMRKQRQNIIEVDSSTREGGVILPLCASEHGTIVQVNKMCVYIYIFVSSEVPLMPYPDAGAELNYNFAKTTSFMTIWR